jgi:hypothetical protein
VSLPQHRPGFRLSQNRFFGLFEFRSEPSRCTGAALGVRPSRSFGISYRLLEVFKIERHDRLPRGSAVAPLTTK